MRHRARRLMPVALMVVASLALATVSAPVRAEGGVPPVVIRGEGTWDVYRMVVPWQDDLISAASPVDFKYVSTGTYVGRQDFLEGKSDFVISGYPFTSDELAAAPDGRRALIDAPVQVGALAFLLADPSPDGFQTITFVCDPAVPENYGDPACFVKVPFTSPIRVPHQNLAAMAMRVAGVEAVSYNSWNDPNVLRAVGLNPDNGDSFSPGGSIAPAPVLRSEPDASTYYLLRYVAEKAPAIWSRYKQDATPIQLEPIDEKLRRQTMATRQGVDQQTLTLAFNADPATGAGSNTLAGVLAPTPPSAKVTLAEAYPQQAVRDLEMQNANGDWVGPTPAAIDKAVEAGGDTPLYALDAAVPGAYPLVWINHLYVPATGLSVEKTEVLAMVIRYLATAGQAAADQFGEGHLSSALVAKSLFAADQLVTSSCSNAGGQVVSSPDPGPYAPPSSAMAAIGAMLHCLAVPGVSTTAPSTTEASALPPTQGALPSFASGSRAVDAGRPATTADGASPTPSGAASAPAGAATGVLVLAKLPLPAPGAAAGGQLDRLASLLIGAGLYLVVRKPVRRLLAPRSP